MSYDKKHDKKFAPIDLTGDDDYPDDVSTHVFVDERYPDSQEGAGRYSSEAPAPSLYESGDGTQPQSLEPPAPPSTPDSKGTPTALCYVWVL